MRTYYIFMSHSWKYDYQYRTLKQWLDESSIYYQDYSVPFDDPIHTNSSAQLRQAIDNKIRCSSVIVVLAGVYATYSKWINIEIELAQNYGKTIIAVSPWGQERISQVVRNAAHDIVGWNRNSLINAITNNVQ